MGIMKGFKFDGEKSLDYGVYISGDAAYNAPEREVEMVTVPGRNGQYALDRGRFENIEVTYPAGTFGNDQSGFATKMAAFRNFAASRKGYKRLEDDYNPNEYRMALFKSGLDVSPEHYSRAGEFDIIFNCKPERWLKSGESAVTMTDGGTITNPTLFESSPLLEVTGYGTIDFNGYEIELANQTYGQITLKETSTVALRFTKTLSTRYDMRPIYVTFDEMFEAGDTLYLSGLRLITGLESNNSLVQITALSATDSGTLAGNTSTTFVDLEASIRTTFSQISISTNADVTKTQTVALTYTAGGTQYTGTLTYTLTHTTANQGRIAITARYVRNAADPLDFVGLNSKTGTVTVNSSKSILGTPTYIDCDSGEAYKIENDEVLSLNQYLDLGNDLPKLAPGSNTVNFDNTVTNLDIIPRWWTI